MPSLDEQMALANKDLGDRTVFQGDSVADVERIPCGILAVDLALGGGFPTGTIVEAYGAEGSGKSSVAMRLVAEAQRRGGKCLYVDVENGFNRPMAESSGIDMDSLLISQPETGEDALKIVNLAVQGDDCAVVVVDSVAGLVPRAEMEGDIGDSHVGLQARMMSQELRVLRGHMSRTHSKAIVVFIKFWATVRVEITKTKQIKPRPDDDPIGHEVKVKVVKNRTAPPLRTTGFDMIYSRGISNGSCVLDLALDYDLVKKNGNWFTDVTTGEKLGQGRQAVTERLDNEPELCEALTELIKAAWTA
jgi:recombination protein RecA